MRKPRGDTHTTRAQIELRKRILSGEFAGGTRLFEVQMAEQLNISRTPVRDAMSRLVEEGLLDRARGGGFVVRTFSFADAIDAIELRGVLEGTAARLAAERGVEPAALQRVQDIVQKLDACFGGSRSEVDFEAYSRLNAEFHRELAALSRSEIVRREVERVSMLPFASPSAFLISINNAGEVARSLHFAQEQHRSIVAAIADGEGARAEALAREHARTARKNLEHVMGEDGGMVKSLPILALVRR